jgi:hypothetical protein
MAETQMDDVQMDAVPYRNQEEKERWGAGLEMEDGRRRESHVPDPRIIPAEFRNTPIGEIMKWSRSPSAKRRQRQVLTKQQELREQTQTIDGRITGPLAPATVLNLNPVALRLSGMLYHFMVPQAGFSDDVFVRFKHKGRVYSGHYVTIHNAHIWTATTGVSTDTTLGIDTPSTEAKYIPPIGLAHQFYDHYVTGAQDAQRMGGILVLEGDKRALKRALESDQGYIYKPIARPLMDGQGGVVYRTERVSIWDEIEEQTQIQAEYCDAKIVEAHAWHVTNNIIQQNMISAEHRAWAHWAVKMGFLDKLPPWATKQLSKTTLVEVVSCKDCGQVKPEGDAFICQGCGRPYDIFQAFMNGVNVAPQYLEMLEGEEFDQVAQALAERRKKRAKLEGGGTKAAKETKAAAEK